MTNREFLNAVVANVTDEELVNYAKGQLDKMDRTNEARRNTLSQKAKENAPLTEKILNEVLSDKPMTSTEIGEVMGVSHNKATALVKPLVEAGKAVVQDVKIPGKGVRKAYSLVPVAEDVADEEDAADAE